MLPAGGLGDAEHPGDLRLAVGERLALHERQHGQGDRLALLEGAGRTEHRVAVEERFWQPGAGGAFPADPGRAEPINTCERGGQFPSDHLPVQAFLQI